MNFLAALGDVDVGKRVHLIIVGLDPSVGVEWQNERVAGCSNLRKMERVNVVDR